MGVVEIAAGVTLIAEGQAQIRCVAGCAYSDGSVLVAGGGTLDGFTGDHAGDRRRELWDQGWPRDDDPPAVVRRVTATHCARYGVLTDGSVDLGPDVRLVQNVASGLYSGGMATQRVRVSGGGNVFDQNGGEGLRINASKLVLDGASASNNGGNGVLFEGYPTDGSTVDHLVATDNGLDGIRVVNEFTTLRVGTSTLLRNAGFGVRSSGLWRWSAPPPATRSSSTSRCSARPAPIARLRGSVCLVQSAPTVTVTATAWLARPCPARRRQLRRRAAGDLPRRCTSRGSRVSRLGGGLVGP